MRIPKYRKHSQKDFAFVQYQGKRVRLPGRYNTPESRQAYQAIVKSIRLRGAPPLVAPDSTIRSLILAYSRHALEHYHGSGPRGEYSNILAALKRLSLSHGDMAPTEFGPLALKNLRQQWIEDGLSRGYINSSVNRIKRMFRWAVGEEIIPPHVLTALNSVPGLLAHRTAARETEPRTPVTWEQVQPVLDHVSTTIRDMILVQWYTGVRSDSLCQAQSCQFIETDQGLVWRPRHKTQYRGHELVVPIGPQCRCVLSSYLPKVGFLFQPCDDRKNRRYGQRYSPSSYRQAVHRGQQRAGLRNLQADPPILGWVPHQLRHARGTLVRSKFGIEAAQAILGHSDLDATQIYAQRSMDLAWQAAREMG